MFCIQSLSNELLEFIKTQLGPNRGPKENVLAKIVKIQCIFPKKERLVFLDNIIRSSSNFKDVLHPIKENQNLPGSAPNLYVLRWVVPNYLMRCLGFMKSPISELRWTTHVSRMSQFQNRRRNNKIGKFVFLQNTACAELGHL